MINKHYIKELFESLGKEIHEDHYQLSEDYKRCVIWIDKNPSEILIKLRYDYESYLTEEHIKIPINYLYLRLLKEVVIKGLEG